MINILKANLNSFLKIFLGLIIFVFLINNASADPKELIADSIKKASSIDADMPTKQRLSTYAKIFENIEALIEKHAGSDEAIQILSNQDIGNFSPATLRGQYISELSSYYNTVCQAAPSFMCLGFVSLKNGLDLCKSASNISDIYTAHMNIKNATQVFIGQNKQKDLISLGINSYRSCFNQSNIEKTAWAVDYFNSALVNLMIQSNRKQMARGMIENMNEPYFKFKSILELSESENKVFDSKYMDRLEKYISGKMKSGQSVANLMLTIKAIQLSDMAITSNIASDAVKKYNTFGIDKCNYIYARGLFNLTTKYQFLLATLDKSRGDFSKNHELMFSIAKMTNAEEKGLNICKENGFYDYYMTAVIYGQLLIDNGVVLANNYKDKAIKKYLSTEQQVELTLATLVNSLDDLKKIVAYASKDNQDYKPAYNAIFSSPMARFHIFKSYVDYGEACEASKILFQEIKSNNDKSTYEKAINYMISSSAIDSSLKYKCGDEDLELLLN